MLCVASSSGRSAQKKRSSPPPASTAPQLCPEGSYSSRIDLQSDAECSTCPRGHSCGAGARVPETRTEPSPGDEDIADEDKLEL